MQTSVQFIDKNTQEILLEVKNYAVPALHVDDPIWIDSTEYWIDYFEHDASTIGGLVYTTRVFLR